MEPTPPPLFVRGPAPLVRLAFFILLSVLLMVLDARLKYIDTLREGLIWVVYPIQRAAMAPIELFEKVSGFFASQSRLQSENTQLRIERLQTAQDVLKLQSVQAENAQLRSLLAAKEKAGGRAVFAEIIYYGRDPFSRKVIIDKGSQQGIELGEPVIDSGGVIGQVTRVHPLVAEVTLVIDKDHAIPVQIVRTGLRGVAFGSGDGSTLELRYLAANVEIENGDVLVTSGIDGVYPAGLPVGRVSRIDKDAAFSFARITCTPSGGPGQNKEVLVLSKMESGPAYPGIDAPPTRKATRSGRRGSRATPQQAR